MTGSALTQRLRGPVFVTALFVAACALPPTSASSATEGPALASSATSALSAAAVPTERVELASAVRSPGAVVRRPIFSLATLHSGPYGVSSEDFEGSFPKAGWTRYGNPSWGATAYDSSQGYYSGYCAGAGAGGQSAPGYVDNMNAQLVFGPFDLRNTSAARLQFWRYIDTEPDADRLQVMASANGTNYYGYGWSGWSQDWVSGDIDLAAVPTIGNLTGQPQVWIMFRFVTDGTVNGNDDWYEGAFIDDIRIEATPCYATTMTAMVVTKTSSNYNCSAKFSSVVMAAGERVPDRTDVAVYRRATDTTWTADGAAAWNAATLSYEAVRSITEQTYVQFRMTGDSVFLPCNSMIAKVTCKASLSTPVTPSTARRNRYFTTYGYLKPRHAGSTRLYFYRLYGGRWHYIASRSAPNADYSTYTKYSCRYRPPTAGSWRVKACHEDAGHIKTWSPARRFTVR